MVTGLDEARARRALEGAGLDMMMPLERASSVTNEVWLAQDYVIRVNRNPDQRLRREATLAPQLPPTVGYPQVVAYGGELGADWYVCRRVEGTVLSRAWPSMSPTERKIAVKQLARRLRALHEYELPDGLPPTRSPQLLGEWGDPAPAQTLLAGLARTRDLPNIDTRMIDEAIDIVRSTGHCLDDWDARTTIHGDLHFENVLWDGTRITALLDFEYARSAPIDLELDVFLRFCSFPYLHVAPDYEHLTKTDDYADVPFWLADYEPELFGHPDQYERLRLYTIAYDVRDLLEMPPPAPARELSEHHAANRLWRTVEGRGHLERLRREAVSRSA